MARTKTGKCKTCDACKRVYIKYAYRYWRDKLFYCTKLEEIIDYNGSCEMWQEKTAPDLSAQRFEQVINDIAVISEILKDI